MSAETTLEMSVEDDGVLIEAPGVPGVLIPWMKWDWFVAYANERRKADGDAWFRLYSGRSPNEP